MTTPRHMRRTPSEPLWRDIDNRQEDHRQPLSPTSSSSSSSAGTPSPTQAMSPTRSRRRSHTHAHDCAAAGPAAPEKIYVLSADGSQLFLIDPSKPLEHEEPPPYATVVSPRQRRQRPGLRPTGSDPGIERSAESEDRNQADPVDRPGEGLLDGQNALGVTVEQDGEVGVGVGARTTTRRHRGTGSSVPTLGSAVLSPPPLISNGLAQVPPAVYPEDDLHVAGPSRHRASTMSSLQSRAADLARASGSHTAHLSPSRPAHRVRHHSSATVARGVVPGHGEYHPPTSPVHLRRNLSRATLHTATPSAALRRAMSADERTPLLYRSISAAPAVIAGESANEDDAAARRGVMRSIFCGDLDADEVPGQGAGRAWRRYWRPLGRKVYWRGLIHLLILNSPLVRPRWRQGVSS